MPRPLRRSCASISRTVWPPPCRPTRQTKKPRVSRLVNKCPARSRHAKCCVASTPSRRAYRQRKRELKPRSPIYVCLHLGEATLQSSPMNALLRPASAHRNEPVSGLVVHLSHSSSTANDRNPTDGGRYVTAVQKILPSSCSFSSAFRITSRRRALMPTSQGSSRWPL